MLRRERDHKVVLSVTPLTHAIFLLKRSLTLLHQTLVEFEARKVALFDRGFPQPDPTTGMYDMVAINAWMDQRHPLTSGVSTERQTARNPADVAAERQRRLFNG